MWQVKFLNEAKRKDLAKLDNSLKGRVLKGLPKMKQILCLFTFML